MRLSDYQRKINKNWRYPTKLTNFLEAVSFNTIGLTEEAGEVAGEIKRYLQEDGDEFVNPSTERIVALQEEMGDLLAYLSALASLLNIDLEDVLEQNIYKVNAKYDLNIQIEEE